MIGSKIYSYGRDLFEEKIEHFNFYGCQYLKDKVEDMFLDKLEEFCQDLDDIEIDVDSKLDNFNWEEAYREEEQNEAIDRLYEQNRDAENDFYLTR